MGCVLAATAVSVLSGRAQPYLDRLPRDHPAIEHGTGPLANAVADLEGRLARGETTLEFADGGPGYLAGLLDALGVARDTQALVFSKTSFQKQHIGPRTPRAIYFADDVAVAYTPDALTIEIAAVEPGDGVIFYTLDTARHASTEFLRPPACLTCHVGPATLGVPGLYVGSVQTNPSGRPDFRLGSIVTDHRTPFEDRWGGWYVTGTHGNERHRGNTTARHPSAGVLRPDSGQNLVELPRHVDRKRYLEPTSDLVALMTLEHQTQMTNLMTRVSWETRIAESEGRDDDRALDTRIDELVRYMLFADEAPLSAPLVGVSTFTETFPARGPRDSRGRSLRDFKLETRLFAYPLSYMIYSSTFDALPDGVRDQVYERLRAVLTAEAGGDSFARLTTDDRRAVMEILVETKPGLPRGWAESNLAARAH